MSAEVDAAFDDETISELTYGETLIPAAVEILDALDVKPGDTLFELGAGRGIFALTAATICDLQVEAVDRLRPFIDVGRWLCELLGIESIRWRCEDLVEVDLSAADHVYVSGTCLKESRLDQLTDNMSQLRSGARVASITCYLDSPQLRDVARLQLPFSWGMSSVYIQERV